LSSSIRPRRGGRGTRTVRGGVWERKKAEECHTARKILDIFLLSRKRSRTRGGPSGETSKSLRRRKEATTTMSVKRSFWEKGLRKGKGDHIEYSQSKEKHHKDRNGTKSLMRLLDPRGENEKKEVGEEGRNCKSMSNSGQGSCQG